ncbi:TetR/AcrR family transcriptional regulator [Brucella sp. IR073]|uniref:TetR/AcrR family transcriptional regulator n=1 Tax=unclassified Brucella TaxID=2632610 RepID=UPI003B986B7B
MKATREEIILAARELFREKGYAGASMQDLASRVGLKKASLYMRFPNKEALVPVVLEMTYNDTFARRDVNGTDWSDAYEAAIRSIAAGLMDVKRCVGLHLAYGIGDETPIAKKAVRDFFQALRDRLSGILAEIMPRERAETVAADALVRLEGATLLLALFDDRQAMERAVAAALTDAASALNASH